MVTRETKLLPIEGRKARGGHETQNPVLFQDTHVALLHDNECKIEHGQDDGRRLLSNLMGRTLDNSTSAFPTGPVMDQSQHQVHCMYVSRKHGSSDWTVGAEWISWKAPREDVGIKAQVHT